MRRVMAAIMFVLMWTSGLVVGAGFLFMVWVDMGLGLKVLITGWVTAFFFAVAWACLND